MFVDQRDEEGNGGESYKSRVVDLTNNNFILCVVQ